MACRQSYRDMHVLYECVRMCVNLWHCTCTWMGSSPGRRISLLSVAHLVVEKIISGTRGTLGDEAHTGPQS